MFQFQDDKCEKYTEICLLEQKSVRNLKKQTCNQGKDWIILLTIVFNLYFLSLFIPGQDHQLLGQNRNQTEPLDITNIPDKPSLIDSNLKIETIASGFKFPTSITFLGKNDILLLEKNTGNVYRIVNGNVTNLKIHFDVLTEDERGLLGIAISRNDKSKQQDPFVFIYYTSCSPVKADLDNSEDCGNYVYRYKFDIDNGILVNPKLILKLPFLPGPSHNGGVIVLGKDKNLYVTIGDLQTSRFNINKTGFDTKAQNIKNGTVPDGRAGILRITNEGKSIGNGILGDKFPLNLYYAYGIRNSFGLDIDPITGSLWDTENGPWFGDEINLVESGHNSGWEMVQGIWKLNHTRSKSGIYDPTNEKTMLVDFNGKGKYSNPEFVWDKTIGPTALIFLTSDELGPEYENDIFVGSLREGIIYHFDLDKDRKSLSLKGDLADLVMNEKDNISQITFGKNFGIVTDMEVGPDGYLYIVSGNRETDVGAIYRIAPNSR